MTLYLQSADASVFAYDEGIRLNEALSLLLLLTVAVVTTEMFLQVPFVDQ